MAFVLHDVSAVPFDQIGQILERTPEAARQLASRARRRVQESEPAIAVDFVQHRAVITAFTTAARAGDLQGLLAVLAPDVVLRSDADATRLGSLREARGAAAVPPIALLLIDPAAPPTEVATMHFVLVIYQGSTPLPTDPEAWSTLSPDDQKAIYRDYAALSKTAGVTPGLTLGLPKDAITVQVQDGKTVTRSGPYLSEGAGGYLMFEADDPQAAVELAARIPAARHGGAIEVRPVATYW